MINAQKSNFTFQFTQSSHTATQKHIGRSTAAATSQRSHNSHILRALLALALIVALTAARVADAQMTFSDGWGKRSVMMKPERRSDPVPAAAAAAAMGPEASAAQQQQQQQQLMREEQAEDAMDVLTGEQIRENRENICHRAYLSSVAQLHEQIMNMYGSYERCKEFANKPVTTKRTVGYGHRMQRG